MSSDEGARSWQRFPIVASDLDILLAAGPGGVVGTIADERVASLMAAGVVEGGHDGVVRGVPAVDAIVTTIVRADRAIRVQRITPHVQHVEVIALFGDLLARIHLHGGSGYLEAIATDAVEDIVKDAASPLDSGRSDGTFVSIPLPVLEAVVAAVNDGALDVATDHLVQARLGRALARRLVGAMGHAEYSGQVDLTEGLGPTEAVIDELSWFGTVDGDLWISVANDDRTARLMGPASSDTVRAAVDDLVGRARLSG